MQVPPSLFKPISSNIYRASKPAHYLQYFSRYTKVKVKMTPPRTRQTSWAEMEWTDTVFHLALSNEDTNANPYYNIYYLMGILPGMAAL